MVLEIAHHTRRCMHIIDGIALKARLEFVDTVSLMSAVPCQMSMHLRAVDVPVDVQQYKESSTLAADSLSLWERYKTWLYRDEELGLDLDISRMGFTDEFVAAMEPRVRHLRCNCPRSRLLLHILRTSDCCIRYEPLTMRKEYRRTAAGQPLCSNVT